MNCSRASSGAAGIARQHRGRQGRRPGPARWQPAARHRQHPPRARRAAGRAPLRPPATGCPAGLRPCAGTIARGDGTPAVGLRHQPGQCRTVAAATTPSARAARVPAAAILPLRCRHPAPSRSHRRCSASPRGYGAD
ncbi:hypothetical protein G6F35_015921 [Rhizopus arrhizus]|nr:hypothetical protein G6F35_015921 [Rhizopus arrhizus]